MAQKRAFKQFYVKVFLFKKVPKNIFAIYMYTVYKIILKSHLTKIFCFMLICESEQYWFISCVLSMHWKYLILTSKLCKQAWYLIKINTFIDNEKEHLKKKSSLN